VLFSKESEKNFFFGPRQDRRGKFLGQVQAEKTLSIFLANLLPKRVWPRRWQRNENKGPNSKRRFYAGQINSETSRHTKYFAGNKFAKAKRSAHTQKISLIRSVALAQADWETNRGFPSTEFSHSPPWRRLSVCQTVAAFWQNTETKSTSLQVVEQKIEKYFQAFVAIVGCQTRYPQQCRLLYPKKLRGI